MSRKSPRGAPPPDGFETRMYEALISGRLRQVRPKNHGVVEIRDFSALAQAMQCSPSVSVLYLQAQPRLDDAALRAIGRAAVANKKITGLNLGELRAVTAQGWREFADIVPSTGIVDCYAQASGGGPSKDQCRRIKAGVMSNRRRLNLPHGLHPSMWRTMDYISPDPEDVERNVPEDFLQSLGVPRGLYDETEEERQMRELHYDECY